MSDPIQQTIDTYDQMAESYRDRYLSQDSTTTRPMLDKFLGLIASVTGSAQRVLDIGSGAGFDSKYLSENGCNVTGIDLSDSFLDIAREVAPKAEFLKMDIREISFDPESFKGVWACASLLHLPRTEVPQVLNVLFKILSNNGVLFLAMKSGEGEKIETNKGEGNLDGAVRFFSYFSEIELIDLVTKAGFQIIETTTSTNRENTWINIFAKK
jgi:2-polyprenyl-3-methyl-5-hydroxy-6-metoxy-1,4-benzoquinol methylase